MCEIEKGSSAPLFFGTVPALVCRDASHEVW